MSCALAAGYLLQCGEGGGEDRREGDGQADLEAGGDGVDSSAFSLSATNRDASALCLILFSVCCFNLLSEVHL